MSINIFFADVSRCEDPKSYIREKLYSAWEDLPRSDLDQLANNAYGDGKSVSLPLTKKDDFPSLTEQQKRSIDKKTKLFVAAVDGLSQLLDGEIKQEEDFVTYLCEEFRGYARGTPVLVRITNYSTICYIFENVSFNAKTVDVYYQVPKVLGTAGELEIDQQIDAWMKANIPSAATPKAEEIIGKLAKGLTGLLPAPYNVIGATLLNIIVPSGGGIDYNQLLNDIATIIADANRRQTISTQGGILNGVIDYVNGNYIPQRDAKRSSKTELFNLINPQLADVYKVIGVLKQDEFKKGGISTFISAVTHKYLLYQEMALQDPDVTSPNDSSKATSIRHDAKDDSEHALTVINELQKEFDKYLNDWIKQISPVHIRITDCPKNEYYFHDSHTGYRSPYFEQCGCKDDPRARAEQARSKYISSIHQKYSKDHQDQLPWMREVASNWKKLTEQPLPSQ
jgi:hypothetical protein